MVRFLCVMLLVLCVGCSEPYRPPLKTYSLEFVTPEGKLHRTQTVEATRLSTGATWGGQIWVGVHNFYEKDVDYICAPVGWDIVVVVVEDQ